MLVKILFTLQTVSTNSHTMVGSIKNIGVLQFTHTLEFSEYASDLNINIFTTGKLPSDLIANGHLITAFPHSADRHLITQTGVAVMKRMLRQPVQRQLGGLGVSWR